MKIKKYDCTFEVTVQNLFNPLEFVSDNGDYRVVEWEETNELKSCNNSDEVLGRVLEERREENLKLMSEMYLEFMLENY